MPSLEGRWPEGLDEGMEHASNCTMYRFCSPPLIRLALLGTFPGGEGFRAGRFVYLYPILPHMLTKRPRFLLETGDIFIFSYCSAKIFSTAAGSSGREAMRAAASLTEPKPYSVKMNGIPASAAASASPCVSPT